MNRMKSKTRLILLIGLVVVLLASSISVTSSYFTDQEDSSNNRIRVITNWYDFAWRCRRPITIDHTKVENVANPSTTYANFPVLVYATGLSNIKADGADIRFTLSDGTTELPREIESYSGGTLYAWVKVTLTKDAGDGSNDVIYMYYGNDAATEPAPDSTYGLQNVWNTNYKAVWHLKENPAGTAPQMKDSTSNANHGTSGGFMTSGDQVAGQINGSLDFDGTNDRIMCGDINAIDGATTLTVSAWVKVMNLTNDGMILSKGTFAAYQGLLFWRDETTSWGSRPDTLSAQVGNGYNADARYYGSSSLLNDNNWHYVVMTYVGNSATGLRGYRDGAEDTSQSPVSTTTVPSLASTFTSVYIGCVSGPAAPWFTGVIDEVRISNSVHSDAWIKTEYNNQNSPSSFCIVGPEE